MISDLKPYPVYGDSGVAWLGEVPAHWEVKRGKFLFHEVDERSVDGSEQLLSVSHLTGVTPRKASVTMFLSESTDGYKICRSGDLVINTMWAWMAALGVSQYVGVVSPSYGVYRPQTIELFHSEYLDHLLRTHPYASEYLCRSTGIRSSRLRLYPDDFLDIPVVRPPLPEQNAIVRFLEYADSRIRRAVGARRRLIALFNEEKQAVIHRAVTRGLNPDVPLRPSGVEWLGDVPAHWNISRLKNLAHIKTGERDTINRIDDGKYPFFVRSQNVERINTYSFDGEAILTAGDGAGVAKVFHYYNGKFDYHQRVYKFSDFQGIRGRYLFEYMRVNLRFEVLKLSAKSTVESLRLPMLQNFPVMLPPLEEQSDIVRFIDDFTIDLDRAIASAKREIDLLLEFRTRLIADVVTGKLDVRGVAAGLPETTPGQATLDAFDAPAGDEEDAWTEPGAALEDGDGSGV